MILTDLSNWIHERCRVREAALQMKLGLARLEESPLVRIEREVLRANLPRRLRDKSLQELGERVGRDPHTEFTFRNAARSR